MVETYSYLGPAGTFTEAALAQVPQAQGKTWRSVSSVSQALDDVVTGRSIAAMIAIENSVEGGVSATQDALASIPNIRITGEYLVDVDFSLVARPGLSMKDLKVIVAHPVAYAQCLRWLDAHLGNHEHIPATSNVSSAFSLLEHSVADAAITSLDAPLPSELNLLAEKIADNRTAVTRFVLVSRSTVLPEPTGADKTSMIVELPDNHPGALLELLEQFSTRGVNLSLIESRPIGDSLGRYRFMIDAEGHLADERVADAMLGVHRFSPRVTFLGSYPRADRSHIDYVKRYDDAVFVQARTWLNSLLTRNSHR